MVIERFKKLLESGDFDELDEVYAPNALLDANVPAWRFQRLGLDEIVAQYKEWYLPTPVRITGWKEKRTTWGAVIEVESSAGEGEDEKYVREIHIFLTADDRITEHISYCTGPWDRETVARQRAEAPMVRA